MVDSTISLEQLFAQPVEPPRRGGCGSCGSGHAADSLSRCGNGLEEIYPTTAVRFGYMRYIGEFSHPPDMRFSCGAKVIIQTKRGIEMGDQVSLTCNGCDKSVTREQMKDWVERCGQDSFLFEAGRILREASAADLADYARIQAGNPQRLRFCQDLASRYKLAIQIVECETIFGGERMIFYFTAESRIDFRSMVKELTHEYRTRIEMRQIGARDEARLLADFETCGREVCCKVFLKTLRPITMRMAKLQKATLDPSQVSGRCGRLKCCLRYEHIGYEELEKRLPRVGIRVRTAHGEGVVVNRQILTQLVQIRTDSETLITVVAEDIEAVGVDAPARPPDGGSEAPDRRESRPRRMNNLRSRAPEPRVEPAPPEARENEISEMPPDNQSGDVLERQEPPQARPPGQPRRRGRHRRFRGRGRRRGGGPGGGQAPSSG